MSAVPGYLLDIFAATLHIGGLPTIRNLRTRHAVVTGTHLSWTIIIQCITNISVLFNHNNKALINNYLWKTARLYFASGEINPTRCNNCVYSSQWLYSTCFGWQLHPSSGVHMLYMASGRQVYLCCNFFSVLW